MALAAAAEAVFAEDFAGRILPFEATAAARYAEIVVARRQADNPIEGFDALIAATALSAGASVATRDIAGFAGCGLTLIDHQSQDGGLKDPDADFDVPEVSFLPHMDLRTGSFCGSARIEWRTLRTAP
jgi:hypothetical protein